MPSVARSELQREVDQPGLVPVYLAQIQAGRLDQPDLIADPVRHHRCLGVVQHDAFLAIQPARRLVDLGDDGIEAERPDAIAQQTGLGVEHLALPGEHTDELGDLRAEHGAGRNDGGAIRLTVRDRTGLALGEQGIEFGLRHLEQLWYVVRHGLLPDARTTYACDNLLCNRHPSRSRALCCCRRMYAPPSNEAASTMVNVETAAMVGSMAKRRSSHMRRGKVIAPDPDRNSATISSSNEVMKANSAPTSTPGRINGNVTWRKVPHGVAPRLSAARSSRRSSPARLALTLVTTNGTARQVCASTRPAGVPTSR